MRDVQVLAPMYRGACGVDILNERLRSALGIGGLELRWRGRTWRVGDRVIHTRNDYLAETSWASAKLGAKAMINVVNAHCQMWIRMGLISPLF